MSQPTVTSVSPDKGLVAGGTSVTILGTGFTDASGVYFGYSSTTYATLVSAVFTVVSDTEITATAPASNIATGIGPVDVVVTDVNLSPSPINETTIFTYVYVIDSTFSTSTIEHAFNNADGTTAEGYIVFTLEKDMSNNGVSYSAGRIESYLSAETPATYLSTSVAGILPYTVTPDNDLFTLQLDGGTLETFTVTDGIYTTEAELAAAINGAIGTPLSEPLSDYIEASVSATVKILLTAQGATQNGATLAPTDDSTFITDVFGHVAPVTLTGGTGGGLLLQTLVSNLDTGTVPAQPYNARWRVDFHITGCRQQTSWITVPAGGNTLDLYDLIPTRQQV